MKITTSLDCVKVNDDDKEVILYKKCVLVFMGDKDVVLENERVKLYCGSDIIEIYPRDKRIIIKNNHITNYEY